MGTSNNHKEAMILWAKSHSLKYQIEYNKSPKLCKFCDTAIPYEKRNSNKFCNQSCSASYNNVRKEKKYPPTKCKFCDSAIPYEKRNSNKFCNQSCFASYNNVRKEKKYPPTKCKSCDNEFRPKRGSDGTYCSLICQQDYQRNDRLNEWLETGKFPGKITLKKYLTETYGYKCSCCGIDEWNGKELILEIDHIDGIPDNNEPKNLRFICPNCHSQTDTYKGKNIGNGRHYRKVRYSNGQSY
jgi:hypothetical protein